jgi:hypothetical protein
MIAVVRERGLRGQQQAGRDESGYYFGQHVALLEHRRVPEWIGVGRHDRGAEMNGF